MQNSQLVNERVVYTQFENKNSFLKIKYIKIYVKNKFGP
jgi:hypothetical protein